MAATYTEATIKIYNLNDEEVGSSTAGTSRYPISGLLAGDYYYEIKSTVPNAKGSIREYFTIAADDLGRPNVTFTELTGTVTQNIYDAAESTIISIIDKDNADITSGVNLTINNLPYSLESGTNEFIIGDISTRPDGSILEFTSATYENKKIKKVFPIPTNVHEEKLHVKFTIGINFMEGSINRNSVIGGAYFQYLSDDINLSEENRVIETFYLEKNQGGFTIPNTQAYNGTLKLLSLNTTNYSIVTASNANIKTVSSNGLTALSALNFQIQSTTTPGDEHY